MSATYGRGALARRLLYTLAHLLSNQGVSFMSPRQSYPLEAAGPDQASTPGQLVDALHLAFGRHRARAVHAKGIVLEGTFAPTPWAATLSRAAHLQRASSTVSVRFSNFTGLPDIHDGDPRANPRGFAIKFRLPDGTTTDLVAHSYDGFPTRTSDEFRALLLAIADSGSSPHEPTALDAFLDAHPVAKTFLTRQKTPASYATITYYGVNAFELIDQVGSTRFVRYQFVPATGEQLLAADAAAARGPDFLREEIALRIAREPIEFQLLAQIAGPSDDITDPSVAWPETRRRVPLGTVTLTQLADASNDADQALAFNPRNLPDGIRSADPMLDFRARAYPISLAERQARPAAGSGNGTALQGAAGRLFYRAFRPNGRPRAVLVIVPGFNAHSGYYEWVAARCVAAGLCVYALDLRGRGQSEGERFFVEDFADYTDDVARCVDMVETREPGLAIFMLGHSAGGVVACLYALDHPTRLSGLVCESFAFQVPAPELALSLLKGLSHLAPHAHVLTLKNEDFSRDPAAVTVMSADPLIAHEVQPLQTIAAMVRADARLQRELKAIRVPVLIIHGTHDKAAKPSGSQLFYTEASSNDKTLKLYDGYFHDPLNDLGKDIVMNDVLAWISARIDPTPTR